jgi:hypothetical protein
MALLQDRMVMQTQAVAAVEELPATRLSQHHKVHTTRRMVFLRELPVVPVEVALL